MPDCPVYNLLADVDPPPQGERFETLLRIGNVEIERIVSSSHPEHTEYEQEQDEWVMLLAGTAALDVDGRTVELGAGEAVFLPASVRHRVLRTTQGAVWLAVHVHGVHGVSAS